MKRMLTLVAFLYVYAQSDSILGLCFEISLSVLRMEKSDLYSHSISAGDRKGSKAGTNLNILFNNINCIQCHIMFFLISQPVHTMNGAYNVPLQENTIAEGLLPLDPFKIKSIKHSYQCDGCYKDNSAVIVPRSH